MKFLEKDLEQIICKTDASKLQEKGLPLYGKLLKQVRIGTYGIADLVTIEKPYYCELFKCHYKGMITVYELKKDKISVSAFFQAVRYVKGIKRFLDENGHSISSGHFNFTIRLIGSEIDLDSSLIYLADLLPDYVGEYMIDSVDRMFVDFYTYDMNIDGLNFTNECGYKLTNENF
jgi:hypothetical protein